MSLEKYQAIKAKRLSNVYLHNLLNEPDVVQSEWFINYTASVVLKQIPVNDFTVEIIAYAETVKPLQQIGPNEYLFECILKNDENQRIKFSAYNEEAQRLKNFFRQDYVMHIDGALAIPRSTPEEEETEGTLHCELQAQSYTIVNCLGSQDTIWYNVTANSE